MLVRTLLVFCDCVFVNVCEGETVTNGERGRERGDGAERSRKGGRENERERERKREREGGEGEIEKERERWGER